MADYEIVYDQEDDGRWIASVEGITGAIIHVYGKTLLDARERAHEAVRFFYSTDENDS